MGETRKIAAILAADVLGFSRMAGRSIEDTTDAIIASVKVHAAGAPQSDDIAVLAVRRS